MMTQILYCINIIIREFESDLAVHSNYLLHLHDHFLEMEKYRIENGMPLLQFCFNNHMVLKFHIYDDANIILYQHYHTRIRKRSGSPFKLSTSLS